MTAPPLEESLLTAAPGDPLFAVWGDRLSEAGDPRGALVSLCRQLQEKPGDPALEQALATLVEQNADAWCPRCLEDETLKLTWRDGFVDTVTFEGKEMSGSVGYGLEEEDEDAHYGAGSALHRLISLPTAARISRFSLRCPIDAEGNHGCWGHHEAFVAKLVARDWPWLRWLDFDGATLPSPGELSFLRFGVFHDAEITVGDLSGLWKRVPRLEHLALAQPTEVELGKVNAPMLRTLVFGSADSGALGALAKGRLPSLETLILRIEDPDDVSALLANRSLGSVKHLGLITTPSDEGEDQKGEELLRALLASKRLGQFETIELGGLDASEAGWRRVLAAAPKLTSLRSLRLTTWELDHSVARTDEWMEDSLEFLSALRFSPRGQAIGEMLEAAFPVRWLTATIVSSVKGPKKGHFSGFFHSDGYAEDRG